MLSVIVKAPAFPTLLTEVIIPVKTKVSFLKSSVFSAATNASTVLGLHFGT